MFYVSSRILFIIGFLLGTFISIKIQQYLNEPTESSLFSKINYENWFKSNNFERKFSKTGEPLQLESKILFDKIPIFCLILVRKENLFEAAKNTWTKRCNFVGHVNLTVPLKKPISFKKPSSKNTWITLCEALKNIPDNFKWILIVNDNTFAIMENLRFLLAGINPLRKLYLGHAVQFWNTIYNLGQAGIVLSRGTVLAFKKDVICKESNLLKNREDFQLGHELSNLNITVLDTRDQFNLSTFHPYNWNHLLFPTKNDYNFKSIFAPKCCSKFSVTFNAIDADKMYTYNYLFYSLKLTMEENLYQKKTDLSSDDEVWKKFLKDRNLPMNISQEAYYKEWEKIIESPDSFAKHMKREYHDEI